MSDPIRFEVREGVGIITLNAPERLNALSDAMHPLLNEVFVAAYQAKEARSIILTGAGRAFCAGADMQRLDHIAASRGASYKLPRPGTLAPEFEGLDAPAELMGTYTFPLAMPKPMIAAVNGPCVGVGLVLACCCDVRISSRNAVFSTAFPQRGLMAEAGLAWLMPRLVGHGVASDILLSGRRVEAQEALNIGLVNRVEEPDVLLQAAFDYAKAIAASAAPQAVRLIKQQLWDAHTQSYAQAVTQAHDLLLGRLASDDFAEGVASFREKRLPRFDPL